MHVFVSCQFSFSKFYTVIMEVATKNCTHFPSSNECRSGKNSQFLYFILGAQTRTHQYISMTHRGLKCENRHLTVFLTLVCTSLRLAFLQFRTKLYFKNKTKIKKKNEKHFDFHSNADNMHDRTWKLQWVDNLLKRNIYAIFHGLGMQLRKTLKPKNIFDEV